LIELKHIVKEFNDSGRDVHAVNDVSLTIDDGDIFGIIGFSGAGKSTLVRCINLLGRPTSGEVIIDGRDITALSQKELREARKKIGMIFQHFNLMPSRTVAGNVAFPLKNSGLSKQEIKAKVKKLLDMVEIGDKEDAYPSQLSGGQKQRVAIARALANDPKILLCDEATSALDPQTTHSILELLKRLNKELGITIVVITHEMDVVKTICNKVAVMEHGRVVETGDILKVFTEPEADITRAFIRSTSNLSKAEDFLKADNPVTRIKPGELMARLNYNNVRVSQPIISTAILKFQVYMNIVFADVEIVGDSNIGGTVAIFSGEKENISRALDYFKSVNVDVEVIKDARDVD
jgi:D-methionine transport system ATP-binding protein